ncbi:AAA family ATPase [Streptomyces sp. NPDC053431]|uniref:helix-turn-helix transcriptional regulator n=1 Tax=Streptomyces sp. NPDC053431 TaxID=3365703 RepID=UPI0037D6E8C1
MAKDVLIEREQELGALKEAAQAAMAGSGAAIVVLGPAGAGKTRLLHEARRLAAQQGMRVLAGEGAVLEREVPFGLVRQLFDMPMARVSEQDRAKLLSGAATAAESVLGQRSVAAESTPGEPAVLYGLYWLVFNLSLAGPTALILDDLHWADEPSLRFLAYLLPRLEGLPLLIVASAREHEPRAAAHLIDVVVNHSLCRRLPLAPLSARAVGAFLSTTFGHCPDDFSGACHHASGGNPLLLNELVHALDLQNVKPVAANIPKVLDIGKHAVSRRVAHELRRLPPEHLRIAEAAAVLGSDSTLTNIARLTGLAAAEVAHGIEYLERADLLAPGQGNALPEVHRFRHPLVEAAVYKQTDRSRRIKYHAQAVQILVEAGQSTERAAAHLLRLPPGFESQTVTVLRQAAAEALKDGAPEAALAYLHRLLAEQLPTDLRLELLTQAGLAAARVDLPTAADLYKQALRLTGDPAHKAQIAGALGSLLPFLGRTEEAAEILTETIDHLPPAQDGARRALEAALLNIPMIAVGYNQLFERVDPLRNLPAADTVEAGMLDCMIAAYDTYLGDPNGLGRARAALAWPSARAAAGRGTFPLQIGCWVLVVGDPDEGIAAFDTLIAEARANGTSAALSLCHLYRGLGWLRRGNLTDAETDLREAEHHLDLIDWALAAPTAGGLLAETMIEQGRLAEAEAELDKTHIPQLMARSGFLLYHPHAASRLLNIQGHHEEALQIALQTGRRFAATGGHNPAVIAWRSEAAISLHALHRDREAREYAATELELARRWGAAYSLGRALRITGLLTPGKAGIDLLQEATDVLKPSTARVEHAKSLLALGSALRRNNARAQARPHLTAAFNLARAHQATPVAEEARAELHAAGYPLAEVTIQEGPDSLTASEVRISHLAAQGLTNRQIAQQQFITVKTVEGHLRAAFRKLGINRRERLNEALSNRNIRQY